MLLKYSDVKSETQATPSTDNGYHHSRPASEHDSMLDGSSYRSTDQPGSSDAASENGAQMVPPQSHRQSSTPAFAPSASASPAIHDPSAWQVFYANSENRVYPSYFDRRLGPEISTDYMGYMNMAKNLKHNADAETDRCRQGMKYLEAALYFILSGKAMEHDCETEPSASLRIYTDTLSFIKFVASVFMREKQEGSLNSKLAVISFRCQSLLSLKIYNMRRQEHKDTQRRLNSYFKNFTKSSSGEGSSNANNTSGNANSWNGQRTSGSPSHPSQTPSPAGSVGSEGSQSSGYTTSTEGTRSKNGPPQVGHTPPHPQPPSATPTVPVPTVIHNLLIKQNQLSGHLATAHDMWIEADNYVFKNGIQDFFIELDRACSPLTLHSSLTDLVYYAYCGLHRLKE
ncbi:Has a role in transcriptional regulation [Halocaridina rubra]|uniref:AF4/FMR2 family member lilli n=1 Tax=Halocaridina rubra TaxID=373956 RepID=A0AAN8WUY9_HALRR